MDNNLETAMQYTRNDFSILTKDKPIIYLDNAASTLKPMQVINAIQEYYTEYPVNVHRGSYPLSIRASEAYEKARETLRNFVGADDDYELIFTSGCTDAINMIAHAYQIDSSLSHSKKAFTVSDFEHHSSYVPFQQCAHTLCKEFRTIAVDSDNCLDMCHAEELIKDATILSITGMSNVTGYAPPLRELLAICQKYGTRMIVDVAQLIAHSKVSLQDIPLDALCFSAHKLCGPTGIGVLCIRKEWLSMLPCIKTGGGTVVKVVKNATEFLTGPEGFEAGTPHIAGAIGFAVAVEYINAIGMDRIANHDDLLRKELLKTIESVSSFQILGNNSSIQAPIVSLVSQNIHSHDMSFILDMKKICVRTGHLCAQPLLAVFNTEYVLRISAYFYNTLEEIRILADVLQSIQDIASTHNNT